MKLSFRTDSDGQQVQNCCFYAKNSTLDVENVEKSVFMLTEKKNGSKIKTVSAPFFFSLEFLIQSDQSIEKKMCCKVFFSEFFVENRFSDT